MTTNQNPNHDRSLPSWCKTQREPLYNGKTWAELNAENERLRAVIEKEYPAERG